MNIPSSRDHKINLILATDCRRQHPRDLTEIAENVVRIAPDIAVHVVSTEDSAEVLQREKWKRLTITVSFSPMSNFVPPRGPVFMCRAIPKLDQYARFQASGIPTPRTERFEFGKSYSHEDWSEFVVLKPLPLPMTSAEGNSRIYRTHRLEQLTLASLPHEHFLKTAPGLVQSFVDTGCFPCKWRVLTLFGEPLYGALSRSAVERAPLTAPDDEIEKSVIEPKNLVSTKIDSLAVDEEILAFARRIHEAFPKNPVLGCDILRREQDGALFALEINAGGNVWHFSSAKRPYREALGGRQAMIDQFGAWRKAAEALVRKTREFAA